MQNIKIKSQRLGPEFSKTFNQTFQTFCLMQNPSPAYHPTQNLLITNFKYKNERKVSKNNHLSASAIHSTRQNPYNTTTKRLSQASDLQMPPSQRMNYLRVQKSNSFNRRSYSSKSSDKNSLYDKTIRKCRSAITRVQVEKVVQGMIAKKELTEKKQSFREQKQFVEQLKSNLINQADSMKNSANVKKIILNKFNSNKNYNLILSQSQMKQKTERQKNSLKHFHFKLRRVTQQDNGLRPWGVTKRIQPQKSLQIEDTTI